MLAWIKKKWNEIMERRRLARDIDPEALRELAHELHELAVLAGKLWPGQHEFRGDIRRIQSQMEQLDRLTARPEFKQISPGQRLQLRKSMIRSKAQLIETVQTAPTPTTTLQ